MARVPKLTLFLPRDAMRYSAVFAVVRCPSVYLSITFVHCIQTAEDIVKHLSRPGSPMILVFLTPGADTQFQGEPLPLGRKIHGDGKSLRFSTEITVYLVHLAPSNGDISNDLDGPLRFQCFGIFEVECLKTLGTKLL